MERAILHCDLNNFFYSVESLDYPELQGKAVAVCGSVENRHGIVLAKSEEAKKYGIKTAQTVCRPNANVPTLSYVSRIMNGMSTFPGWCGAFTGRIPTRWSLLEWTKPGWT